MLRTIYLSLILNTICLFVSAQEVSFAHQIGGKSFDYSIKTLTDKQGNVLMLSLVEDTAYLDLTQPLSLYTDTPNYGKDILLTKFTSSGTLIWSHRLGGGLEDYGTFTLDEDDNIIISGNVMENFLNPAVRVDFDFSSDTAFLASGVYLAKYDKDANLLWVKGGAEDLPYGNMTTDEAGNIYMAGAIYFRCDFDFSPAASHIINSHPYNSSTDNGDAFVAKYDSMGNFVWAHSFGKKWKDEVMEICRSGNKIIVGGIFAGFMDVDPTSAVHNVGSWGYWDYPQNTNFESEPFIASYDFNGNLDWFRPVHMGGNSTHLAVSGVANDEEGSVYLYGNYWGILNFDSVNVSAALESVSDSSDIFPHPMIHTYDIYLAKYDSNGVFQWVNNMAAKGDDQAESLCILDAEHIYISGRLYSKAYYPHSLPGFVADSAYRSRLPKISNFIIRLNSENQTYWLYYVDSLRMNTLAVHDANSLYASANFAVPLTIDGIQNHYNFSPYNNSSDVIFFKFNDLTGSGPNPEDSLNEHFLINRKMYSSLNEVSSESLSSFFVYPNPAADVLNFDFKHRDEAQISLYNLDGRVVIKESNSSAKGIAISSLASGIYIAEIKVRGEVQRVRWVKM